MDGGAWIAQVVSNTLGVSFPDFLLIILLLGSLIFGALGFRIWLITTFVMLAGAYVLYYQVGWSTLHVMAAFIICFVMLCLSLFISYSKNKSPGIV